MPTVAFAGGGSGGHIYPGLAVAEALDGRLAAAFPEGKSRLLWIGSRSGMDRGIVERAGMDFRGIPAGRLRRYFTLRTLPDAFRVLAGFFAARAVLKKEKPDLLFSKGGFVSVPPCAAAASLGIPVFAHESDFSPGLATRLSMRFVRRTGGRVFAAYPRTAEALGAAAPGPVAVTGNPVRRAFRSADPAKGRAFLGLPPGARILLVLGGSQGARQIDELVRDCLGDLTSVYAVVHQRASGDGVPATDGYFPLSYIGEELPHVLAAAELVLGRAGAGTVWECATAGRPMVLIPLEGSGTRGDQVENAGFFAEAGAAMVLSGGNANPANLSRTILALAADGQRREAMARAAARIGATDGAAAIADAIAERLGNR